jgi:hypothetical protein
VVALEPAGDPTLDALEPAPLALGCEGGCLLGEGRLVAAAVTVARLEIDATARGGLPGQELEGEVSVRLGVDLVGREHAPSFQTPLDVVVDDEQEPGIALALDLVFRAAAFDAVALGALDRAGDGGIELSAAANSEALAAVLAGVGDDALFVVVQRREIP